MSETDEQNKVWKLIKQAKGCLERAQKLEHTIETERISDEWELGKRSGYIPSSAVTAHDPLGNNIGNIIEKLEDLLD